MMIGRFSLNHRNFVVSDRTPLPPYCSEMAASTCQIFAVCLAKKGCVSGISCFRFHEILQSEAQAAALVFSLIDPELYPTVLNVM